MLRRKTLKIFLFIWKDQTDKTIIERRLIDIETVRTFFNENWIWKNELEIEESSKKELKLRDGNTKSLKRTIQGEL